MSTSEWELPTPTVVLEGPSTKKRDELLHIEKVAQAVWEETKAFEVDAPEVSFLLPLLRDSPGSIIPSSRWISSCVGAMPRCWHSVGYDRGGVGGWGGEVEGLQWRG